MYKNLKSTIYRQLSTYATEESIAYSVLSGYDPDTNTIGRDLDVFVPDKECAIKLLFHFREILEMNGVTWTMVMNPIWGMRCVGVTKYFENIELHIITSVSVTAFPVSKFYSLNVEAFGDAKLLIDPLFMLFKSVLIKRNRSIFKLETIWKTDKPLRFLINHKGVIGKRIGHRFTSLLLRDLDKGEMKLLRLYFVKFLFKSFLIPFSSITQISRSVFIKKIKVLRSPCVPKFVLYVNTTNRLIDILHLKNSLEKKMSEIFAHVYIDSKKNKNFSIPEVAYIQARQMVYIYISEDKHQNTNEFFFESIVLNINNNYESEIQNICNSIIEKTKFFNTKWGDKLTLDYLKIKDNKE